jgi:hypothetical protein
MTKPDQILNSIELHDLNGIRRYFDEGGSPNEIYDGTPLFTTLVEMYTRTPRFKAAVQIFLDEGLQYNEPALLAVLLDNAEVLQTLISDDSSLLSKAYYLHNNTYTPLTGGTLLHYCTEYNSMACAEVLLANGADINARAALDVNGFGGHTPISHAVNQNSNNSAGVLRLLLDKGADLQLTVRGLIWGKGYEWETFIPAVNPISYAMMGLLPQMHRKETTVAGVISLLMKYAYGINYVPGNVPNRYLAI